MARLFAVIPAAGSGQRMGADKPKQYLPLAGKTVLECTLTRLLSSLAIDTCMLCVAPDDNYYPEVLASVSYDVNVVEGGASRAHSVANGLRALETAANQDDWVLVHDAARPCVPAEDLQWLVQSLEHHAVGGLLARPAQDTLKHAQDGEIITTLNREQIWHAMTPQMFRYGLLQSALEQSLEQGAAITDESAAIEALGKQPKIIAGDASNIKITTPADLELAGYFLSEEQRR